MSSGMNTAATFDAAALLALTQGDAVRAQKLVAMYQSSTAEAFASLAQALADGRLAEVRQIAHKIKSSARWVGAMALGELAAQMESAAESPDDAADASTLTQARARFALMTEQLNAISAQLAEFVTRLP